MSNSSEIAVIGMSALFAKAADLAEYWNNIVAKIDAVHDASDAWTKKYLQPGSTENDHIYTRRGGFIGDSIDFKAIDFGIMPNTLGGADTDQFLALKQVRMALEDANYQDRTFNRETTGVILGRGSYINRGFANVLLHGQVVDQTLELLRQLHPDLSDETLGKIRSGLKESLPPFRAENVASLVPNVITGRIANRLDLMGPNFIVDAACASSLIAIEHAMNELRSGACDMVISGGVHSTTPPQIYMMFSLLQALSRKALRPFDASADGTLLGEGLGIVVLKRLSDAQRDGDRIYAVVKSIGSSSDGKALGLLAPRLDGELLAIKRAYEKANIDPQTVGLIEAHGTGMPVGDKAETQCLTDVFGRRSGMAPKHAVGSVKSMIGHCIPAAGAAGFVKAVLALYHKVLPPTLCDAVNPDLKLGTSSIYINTKTRPWIHGDIDAPRRAGVNAFGFGGINSHAILEEYPQAENSINPTIHDQWPTELITLNARTREQLIATIREARRHIELYPHRSLAFIAYEYSKADKGKYRLAIVCADVATLDERLKAAATLISADRSLQFRNKKGMYYSSDEQEGNPGKTAFLFPGEGGQYQNMLVDLAVYFPQVRVWFDLLDEVLEPNLGVAPSSVIFPPPTGLSEEESKALTTLLNSLEVGSAAVFVASMALYELLSEFGVTADIMVGHSTGEGTALIASGIIRLNSRDDLVRGMGRFNNMYTNLENTGSIPKGVFLSVGAIGIESRDVLLKEFAGQLFLALDNCPNQSVLFGFQDCMEKVQQRLKDLGAICLPMPIDRAYHTPLLAPLEPKLRTLYEELELGLGQTPVFSCADVAIFSDEPEAIRQLATKQWSSKVRFRESIMALHEDGVRRFMEVGPGGNLTPFIRDILKGKEYTALSMDRVDTPSIKQLQLVLAQLFVDGSQLDLTPLYSARLIREGNPITQLGSTSTDLSNTMPEMSIDEDLLAAVREELLAKSPVPANFRSDFDLKQAHDDVAQVTYPTPHIVQSKTDVIKTHFDLMQQFLDNQSRVVSMLNRGLGGAALASPEPNVSSPAEVSSTVFETGTEHEWPFLGKIIEKNQTYLYCERMVSLEYDKFLIDHTLGGPLSSRQPELHPLPIIPFTVSMELIAEAAQCLTGGKKKTIQLRDVRGYRWLALDDKPLILGISARAKESSEATEVKVQVHLLQNVGGNSNKLLVFEGTVVVAERFENAPSELKFHFENAPHYSSEQLYHIPEGADKRYAPMFHGPQFQGVKRILSWSADGIEAVLEVLPREKFFADGHKPKFQIDPVILDSAGQMIGFWVAEQFAVDLSFFPFRVREYTQYKLPLNPGSQIKCRGKIRIIETAQQDASAAFEFVSDQGEILASYLNGNTHLKVVPDSYDHCRLRPQSAIIEAVFDFLDESNCVIARLNGWQDRYFSIPNRFYRCRLWPETAYYSDPWKQQELGYVCRRIEPSKLSFLNEAWGIWSQVLAHMMLTKNERAIYKEFPDAGNRQLEWLLGRIAAKDVVRQWAQQKYDVKLAPVDIEILSDEFGRPVVMCPALMDFSQVPEVSISHNKGHVVAIVSEPNSKIGIDLGRTDDFQSFDLISHAFSESEKSLLEQQTQDEYRISIMRMWCAKEAASKAHGTGLLGRPAEWCIKTYSADSGEITVDYKDSTYKVQLYSSWDEIVAIC